MRLDEYLKAANESYAGFARRIGAANGSVVERYAKRQRIPAADMMARIVAETGGRVQPNDFYDLPGAASGAAA